jgi:hypothetical protein
MFLGLALSAAVRAFGRDAADHDLDNQHYSHLLCLAPAHSGRPWVMPDWIVLLECGSVAVAAAMIALLRITPSATPRGSADGEE